MWLGIGWLLELYKRLGLDVRLMKSWVMKDRLPLSLGQTDIIDIIDVREWKVTRIARELLEPYVALCSRIVINQTSCVSSMCTGSAALW